MPPQYEFAVRRLAWLKAPRVARLGYPILWNVYFKNQEPSAPELSQVFILIIILLGHLELDATTEKPYEVLEFFAGSARIARLAKHLGLSSTALDKSYCDGDNIESGNCMDINTDAGFLSLECIEYRSLWVM